MAENSSRISLWGIEVFLATAEEGALSAAARRLGASVSAISQQLSALEAALNTVLIDRSTRPVGLTPAGRMFLPRARAILAESEQARAELSTQDMSALKSLRLGVIEDFDGTVTPMLLSALGRELTSCRFTLQTGASHRLLDQLDARALDIVVSTDPGTAAPGFEVYPLMRDPFVVAAPKGLIVPGGDTLAQLQEAPFIRYTRRHHIGRQIAEHLTQHNLLLPDRFELDSYNAIMAMVAQGAGWTILSTLGILHAQQFQAQVALMPLPLAPFARQISVYARAGEMREMPQHIAMQLRTILQDAVIAPTTHALPWLRDDLVLNAPERATVPAQA